MGLFSNVVNKIKTGFKNLIGGGGSSKYSGGSSKYSGGSSKYSGGSSKSYGGSVDPTFGYGKSTPALALLGGGSSKSSGGSSGNIQEAIGNITGGDSLGQSAANNVNQIMTGISADGSTYTTPTGENVTAQEGYTFGTNDKGDIVQTPIQQDRTVLQKVGDILFGNWLEKNPLSGEVYIDPNTGLPKQVQAETIPIGPAGAAGAAGGAGAVKALGSLDDFLGAAKAESSYVKAAQTITKVEQRGNALLQSGGVVEGVAESAAGVTKAVRAGEAAVNTANAASKLSWLQKVTKFAKNPIFVLGVLGSWVTTGVMSQNEWGDTIQSLSIAITNAQKQGDVDQATQLKDYLDDISDERVKWYLGPFAYVENVDKKIESGLKAAQASADLLEKAEEERIANELMAGKIRSGVATDEEISKYVADNPYSDIAIVYNQNLKSQTYNANAIALQQQIEQIKNAGADYRNNVYQSSGSQTQEEYQAPSSLNFGLLHTSGGYEATKAGEKVTGTGTYNVVDSVDKDSIANYLFGVHYAALTDEQKAVVDKW